MVKDLPLMMTLEDISRYHGISPEQAAAWAKQCPVVGNYFPPKGWAVKLYATEDIVDKCSDGHWLPAPGAECKVCVFLARIA